ncbi:MAG: Gfo/Idh/MocA family oxidoreductase [Verrucomicrobia bacterium]|nr:Gfo/Idh/MocA family oxidoreductase [Verrucomicrobiota bacterium]
MTAAPSSSPSPRFAIIGCGLIGRKRLASLAPGQLAVACDVEIARAEALAKTAGGDARATASPEDAVNDPAVGAVIVATLNGALAELTATALRAGKPVLVEKPAAISVAQLDELIDLSKKNRAPVRVGYNHRFHPALQKAREIVDAGALGPLLFIRGRYGHGGRVGYDREWRADPALSGGGEGIDQGVHLVDLAGWFLGEFTEIAGHAATYFWDMPVDDNTFFSLRTATGQTAWLHVSCTEWKNLFSLEIYGRDGKLHVEGLGGSYGVERLAFYRMLPQMGPPETTIWEYPRGDDSWALEMRAFLDDLRLGRAPEPGLQEARAALAVVEQIYRASGYLKS